jgi:hypothetical protein
LRSTPPPARSRRPGRPPGPERSRRAARAAPASVRPPAGRAEAACSPSRKREGRREPRPPGERDSAQDSDRCSRARVTPT